MLRYYFVDQRFRSGNVKTLSRGEDFRVIPYVFAQQIRRLRSRLNAEPLLCRESKTIGCFVCPPHNSQICLINCFKELTMSLAKPNGDKRDITFKERDFHPIDESFTASLAMEISFLNQEPPLPSTRYLKFRKIIL